MNRHRFYLEGDPRHCLIARALESAAQIHWLQCFFAGLLAWGLV